MDRDGGDGAQVDDALRFSRQLAEHGGRMFRALQAPLMASPVERAQLFRQLVLITVCAELTALALIALLSPEVRPDAYVAMAVHASYLALLPINRLGYTRFASVAFIVAHLARVTLFAVFLTGAGIRSTGVGMYFIYVLVAGLLLGYRAGLFTALACVALGLLLVKLGDWGLLVHRAAPYDARTVWLLNCLYVAQVLIVMRLAAGTVDAALDRTQQEVRERRRTEKRLQLALDAGSVGVWDQELARSGFHADARTLDIYTLQAGPDGFVAHESWMSPVHPEDRSAADAFFARLRAEPRRDTANFRIVRSDGSVRELEAAALSSGDEHGHVTEIAGVVMDVTERRRAEREREKLVLDLGERVKELKLLHRAAGLLRNDRPFEPRILEELVVSMPHAWMYPEVCAARIRYGQQEARSAGWRESPWMQQEEFATSEATGSLTVAYLDPRPVAYEGPFLAEERALLISLTEMLQAYLEHQCAEARRNDLEKQLRQVQKMDALGTLAGGIAHDFNNILTAIGVNVEFALREQAAGSEARECLTEAMQAQARARDLVKQILLFSRQQEPERRVIALAPVVSEAVRLLRASIPQMIRIGESYPADLPNVLADPGQIHQVVMNLGTNAIQAMGASGTFEVALRRVIVGDDGAAMDLEAGDYVRIDVRDTGSGIAPEILDRLFEPFFSTKGLGGTGLGLAVVHGIVKEHHGAITVTSNVGEGTTFYVYLPAAVAAQPQAPEPASEPAQGRGQHVMYVDDEGALVAAISRTVRRLGYRCSAFVNPLEALEAFRADPRSFDAVITDFAMPGLTGLELARELHAIRADVPIALSSGYDQHADADTRDIALRLQKPPTMEDLRGALVALLQD